MNTYQIGLINSTKPSSVRPRLMLVQDFSTAFSSMKWERESNGDAASKMIGSLTFRQKIVIGLLAALLIIPVDILGGSRGTFTEPISIALIPLAIVSFLKSRSVESLLLLLSCLIGMISILVTTSYATEVSLRPLASLILFFSPVTLYFLARERIRSRIAFLTFLKYSLYASVAYATSLFFSIFIFGDGAVRTGGEHEATIAGTFLSLPLSGMSGVQTMVSHCFLICIIIIYYAKSGYAGKVERFAAYLTLAFFVYLMVLSLSREIVLAVLLVAIVTILRDMNIKKALILIALLSFCVYAFSGIASALYSIWETKLYQTMIASNLNELSSGRLDLQELALNQLVRSPLTGTGFYGYELYGKPSGGLDDLAGWSTHMYYLTTIWKMGILGAAVFFLFLFRIIKQSLSFSFKIFTESARIYSLSLFAFLVVMNMLWDVLLAPSIMCLFAFFVGSMASSEQWKQIPRYHLPIGLRKKIVE